MLVNRARFFTLGVTVLVAELMLSASPVAAASSAVNSPQEGQQCEEEGGTFTLWEGSVEDYEDEGEYRGICMIGEPTAEDLCRQELKTMYSTVSETGDCAAPAPEKGNSSGGCFLTTACVEMAGLQDDCYELRVLRRFRDQTLVNMPGGKMDVVRYYLIAPEILRAIERSQRPDRELSRIYVRYILPSVLLSKAGFAELARKTYTAMMDDLARRHSVGSDGLTPARVSA